MDLADLRRAPRWMLGAGGIFGLYALFALFTPERPHLLEAGVMLLKLVVEAAAYGWAASRVDLPPRLRTSLRILGATSLLSIVTLGLTLASLMDWVRGMETVISAGGSASFLLGFVSLLVYPRMSLQPRQALTVALDLAIVIGSLASLQWAVFSLPDLVAAAPGYRVPAIVYAVAQVAMLSGLGLVMGMGEAVPSRRALWWFLGAMSTYVPVTLLGQLHTILLTPWSQSVSMFFYFGGVVVLLVAAFHLRNDAHVPSGRLTGPAWLLGLNPLTLLMPAAVGAALMLLLLQQQAGQVLQLAATLVAASLLIVVRLVLTTAQNARLLREELTVEERLKAQREQARAEERQRMVADMHDGVGSNLTTAALLLGEGTLSQAGAAEVLKECLDDVRLFVDAFGNLDGSLATAVADFRYRFNQRVGPSGLRPAWTLSLSGLPGLPSETLLQLMRILQEALTNVLRHAQARHVSVHVAWDAAGRVLSLCVEDDGVGMPPETLGGKGLKNMRRRAEALGGTLALHSLQPGTRVEFRVAVR